MGHSNGLRRYVAKRTNSTRAEPRLLPTVLGFINALDDGHAGELAHKRWGITGENQIMVMVPVGRCTAEDLRDAAEAELEARHGPAYGKRKVIICGCQTINYLHPKHPNPKCLWCKRLISGMPVAGIVDMRVEEREHDLEVRHHPEQYDIGGSD